jgi:hypothetical protein
MSDMLQKFYNDYANWLRAGAPKINDFLRMSGLCYNLKRWCCKNEIDDVTSSMLSNEMNQQFIAAGLEEEVPFNNSIDYPSYSYERLTRTCHLNEQRRKWVFDRERKVPFIKKILAYFYSL